MRERETKSSCSTTWRALSCTPAPLHPLAAFVDDLTVLADRLSNNADDLIDAADGSGIITEADVEDMRDAVTQIRSISGDIDDEIDQVDFSDLDDFSDDGANVVQWSELCVCVCVFVFVCACVC